MNILWVGLGGALGSMARFAVTMALSGARGFPWATFAVNVLGSLVLGVLTGLCARMTHAEAVRAFAVIGFCGGFTTFSTFSSDAFRLLQDGRFALAAAYVFGSVLSGLVAVGIGWAISR